MKSKITKIQVLKKGMAILMATMFLVTPITYATTSLDDSYLEGSFWEQILYGEIGSTAKEIEEWFDSGKTTLYISNETQLRALAEYVNSGNDCSGKKIILLNNIEVDSTREWIPIGTDPEPFSGIFDGNGYIISGINFNRVDKLYSEISFVGLFGNIKYSTIKNVNISNSKFDIPYDISSDILDVSNDLEENVVGRYKYLGAITGYSSYSTIENCNIDSTVYINGLAYVGGITGYSWACNIENCVSSVDIYGFLDIGGIAGGFSGQINGMDENKEINYSNENYKIGKIISCTNNGDIYAAFSNVGGIAGDLGRDAIIQKCENNGIITSSTKELEINIAGNIEKIEPQNIGGILGALSGHYDAEKKGYATVDSCINNGTVEGYRDVGGIVGQLGALNGGYSIFTNNINYSINVKATCGDIEAGYLAGEVGGLGYDGSIGTNDDPYAYIINNFYVASDEAIQKVKESELYQDENTTKVLENIQIIYDGDTQILNSIEDKMKAVWYLDFSNTINPNSYDLDAFGYTIPRVYLENTNKSNIKGIYNFEGYNYLNSKWEINDDETSYKLYISRIDNLDLDSYKTILTENTNNSTLTIGDIKVKLSDDNAFIMDENKLAINNTSDTWSPDTEYIIDESTGTTVKYSIYKNNIAINGATYFKEGDTIKVTATFNKYLAQTYGPLSRITTAPTLKLNNSIEMNAGTVNVTTSSYTTIIDYTYTVTSEDNLEITSLDLSKSGTMYAISGDDYSENHPSISSINKPTKVEGLIIDITAPIINTKVYVENMLETERYTAGKEIIFEVTTNEKINDTYTLPEIQVSFSESGVGKYNYNEENGAGYAKCTDAKINLDGTTTWTYSYQIQARDEGKLEFTFKAGEIKDLAGNITNIKDLYAPTTEITSEPITGTQWNNDLNVTYEFYKNSVSESNKVTSQTYFTENDDLIVVAIYDKVLYVHYGLSDGKNTNVRLTNTYKDRAPSLYLNGDSVLKQSSIERVTTTDYIEASSTSGTTTIQYKFTAIAKNYGLKNLTQITKVVLKNENNGENINVNGTSAATNGMIPYAEEWYDEYNSEQEENYNTTLTSQKIKTTEGLEDIIIDPVGVSTKIEKSDVYADTTAPTLTITANKSNPTNADEIEYTFEFSEVVEGFEASDITVNNGLKVTEKVIVGEEEIEQPIFKVVEEGKKYTLLVKPTITDGNEVTLQVIVEEGACTDLVAINNVRQENVITVDKVAPTVEIKADKEYVNANETITYTFTWSEGVNEFTADDITVNNGTKGAFTGEGNYYTLEIIPTGENDVEVSVASDIATDNAGNGNIASSKHVIVVLPTVTITTNTSNPTNVSEIEYTFTWSEKVNGFDISDVILPNGVIGNLTPVDGTNSYTMTIDYNSVIPSGNEGEVTVAVKENVVQDSNGNTNAYVSNTTKIDRIAPIFISLEAYAKSNVILNSEVDTVKEYYKAGDTIEIVATFSENVENSTAPTLALQFSESGNVKETVSVGQKDGNKITYTYEITEGDMGTLSIKGFLGTVVDNAGNSTSVTRKALDGNTIIADTDEPSLKELNIVSPSTGTYKAGTTVTIEAIYDEEVYALEDNEIKNITDKLAPILKIKIGNGSEKVATAKGYGETDGKEDKAKIKYTYTIADGDNGLLSITSYENKENVKVCDIAGNEASLNKNQTGNTITADTIRPEVTNITASVEEPTISNTGIYHKAGNEIKITVDFTEEVSSAKLWSRILVGFSEDEEKEPTSYKEVLDLNGNTQTREFTYTIQEDDNGYLWVKVEEGHYADEAGNLNYAKAATKISNVYADTIDPTVTLLRDTEVAQNNQTIIIKAQFSENVYDLNDNTRVTLTKENAPKLIYSFGSGDNKEASASSVDGAIITYTIKKDSVEDNGTLLYELAKGNLCDRAGNEYYTETTDTTAPVLESVVISSNAGIYAPYCNEGKEIYVTATFDEPINAENMKLKAKIGEVEIAELLDGEIVEDNSRQVKFTYTVKVGDMGEFTIVDICGQTDNNITEENADNTYGWVQDVYGNQNNIYSFEDEGVTATGKAEADTENPYITSIIAISGDKEIATYTKEKDKDAVITVGRTKENIVEYIVKYNEKVPYNHFENITVINGEIKEISYTNLELNEYKITVQTTTEGVQSLIVNEGTVEDKAGNVDSFVRIDAVTVDFTKPTVRFISEFNGGVYVLPVNAEKIEIRPNVEISEDIASIEFKWAKINESGNWEDIAPYAQVSNYSSSSDIAIDTQAFGKGDYKLFIRVVDLAGNVTEANKTYTVINSNINIELNTDFYTNQNVIATVTFGDGLTDNRKVTFKSEGSEKLVELNAKETNEDGTKYTIETNGTIYAEATDRVGNKVFTEYDVLNIDKDGPEITFSEIPYNVLKGKSLDISIYTNEYVLISYSWDNENWEVPQKYLTSVDITKSFEEVGEYTLYVKAKDKAGNESTSQLSINVINLDFEVWGNVDDWTSRDVELYVSYEGELASITVNETSIDVEERIYIAKENGEYVFVIADKYGNTATKTIKVEKIDKEGPTIESVVANGKEITITAKDDKSGIKEYAISTTSEIPVEWTQSNVIKTTEDGTFYVWAKDKVGNVTRDENAIVVDTTAPTITFSYTSLTVTVGVPLETNIVTNEDAIISYSWDNETWVDSTELLTSLKVSEKSTTIGKSTLYVKAKDNSGNESKVQTLEFNVVNIEEIRQPEIIFEDIPTLQVNGVKYVKVSPYTTIEYLTNRMNQEALSGKTPEYTELTEDGKLKTGSEISINGETKFVVVVKGDVNSDGEIDFIKDIIRANNYRLGIVELSISQILAADINSDGKIEFIQDIIAINNFRLGLIKSL